MMANDWYPNQNLATVQEFLGQTEAIGWEGFLPSGDPLGVLKWVLDPYVPGNDHQDNDHDHDHDDNGYCDDLNFHKYQDDPDDPDSENQPVQRYEAKVENGSCWAHHIRADEQ